jgi:hypothetical protein
VAEGVAVEMSLSHSIRPRLRVAEEVEETLEGAEEMSEGEGEDRAVDAREVVSVKGGMLVVVGLLPFTPSRFSGKACFQSLLFNCDGN